MATGPQGGTWNGMDYDFIDTGGRLWLNGNVIAQQPEEERKGYVAPEDVDWGGVATPYDYEQNQASTDWFQGQLDQALANGSITEQMISDSANWNGTDGEDLLTGNLKTGADGRLDVSGVPGADPDGGRTTGYFDRNKPGGYQGDGTWDNPGVNDPTGSDTPTGSEEETFMEKARRLAAGGETQADRDEHDRMWAEAEKYNPIDTSWDWSNSGQGGVTGIDQGYGQGAMPANQPGYLSPWGGNADFYRNQFQGLLDDDNEFQRQQQVAEQMRAFAKENPLENQWDWSKTNLSQGGTPQGGQSQGAAQGEWSLNPAWNIDPGVTTNQQITEQMQGLWNTAEQDQWNTHWANPESNPDNTNWGTENRNDIIQNSFAGTGASGAWTDTYDKALNNLFIQQGGGGQGPTAPTGYAPPVGYASPV